MQISETREPIPDVNSIFRQILAKMKADEKNAWPFLEPVDPEEVPEYYEHIAFPIDLKTIGDLIKKGYYTHVSDLKAIIKKCFRNIYLLEMLGECLLIVTNLTAVKRRIICTLINLMSFSINF